MHTTLHPIALVGLGLIAAVIAVYLVAIIAAILRMRRQYNSAIAGMGALRVAASFSAAARLWPLTIVLAIGVGLYLLGR